MSFQLGIDQVLYNLRLANRDLETVTTQLSTGQKVNSSQDDPVVWSSIMRSRSEFSNFTAINDSLNTVATSIQIADTTMDTIGKTVDDMKNALQSILQQVPPLSIGSEQRTMLLQTYAELRAQIDQLANPTDAGAKKIMAGPDDWTVVIGPNGMTRTVRKEEVHTGPSGLNIPALTDTSSDADIQAALASLDAAKDTLTTRKQDLEMDSVAIANAQTYNGKLASAYQVHAENAGAADMNEAAAQEKSLELRQSLSNESLKILTDADARILQLLG